MSTDTWTDIKFLHIYLPNTIKILSPKKSIVFEMLTGENAPGSSKQVNKTPFVGRSNHDFSVS